MGPRSRKLRNKSRRSNGNEPQPGLHAGINRRARYLKRIPQIIQSVRNPERYLSSHQRDDAYFKAALEATPLLGAEA